MAATKDLAKLLEQKDPEKYKAIIERAANNGYSDYKFDNIPNHPEYGLCVCPKMQLVNDLSAFPELSDIRKQVMDGVYDETADQEDIARLRGHLIDDNSPDGAFTLLGFEVPTKQEREDWKKKTKLN